MRPNSSHKFSFLLFCSIPFHSILFAAFSLLSPFSHFVFEFVQLKLNIISNVSSFSKRHIGANTDFCETLLDSQPESPESKMKRKKEQKNDFFFWNSKCRKRYADLCCTLHTAQRNIGTVQSFVMRKCITFCKMDSLTRYILYSVPIRNRWLDQQCDCLWGLVLLK